MSIKEKIEASILESVHKIDALNSWQTDDEKKREAIREATRLELWNLIKIIIDQLLEKLRESE